MEPSVPVIEVRLSGAEVAVLESCSFYRAGTMLSQREMLRNMQPKESFRRLKDEVVYSCDTFPGRIVPIHQVAWAWIAVSDVNPVIGALDVIGMQKRTDPLISLRDYWNNTDLMHEMAEFAFEDVDENGNSEETWQIYRTYYTYWLASLYVLMEGFEALGLKDPVIDDLMNKHRDSLRLFRNSAFHFQRKAYKFLQFHDEEGTRLKWAEEVHEAFEAYFKNN